MPEPNRKPDPTPTRPDDSFRPLLIGALAAGVLLVATVLSVTRVWQAARDTIDHEVRSNLSRLATSVAATVDAPAHAGLTDPGQHAGPDYEELNAPLRRVLEQTDRVRFVYTLREHEGRVVFVLDGTPEGDADGDGVEDHSSLMEVYATPDPAAIEALRTGRVVTTEEPYTDAWGTFLSAFAPVRLPDGTVDAVVGLDVSLAEYDRRMDAVNRAAVWGVLPGLALSLAAGIAAWWVSRWMLLHAREVEGHREAAERANRAKSAILANISHELRTPLTAIKGFVEIAEDRLSDGTARIEALTTVRHNANHLLVLINDLLEMSRIEAGAIVIEPVEVDPREVVRTAVAPLALRAKDKQIALDVVGLDTLPSAAVLDPTRVRQILLNLLSNAVKFTERGRVRLVVSAGAERLVFAVEDSGPGMDESQMGQLFQPFSQVGGSAAKRREGTGLGLAISQHLAGLMGGRITVTSTPGAGSVFTAEVAYGAVETGGVVLPAGDCVPGGPLAGRRILLAEDGTDIRKLLRFILKRAGAEVEEHPDGHAALEAMHENSARIDLVVTDWDMPRLDGAGLVRGLRAMGWRGPVVSLTAHAMPEQQAACEAAGCDAHLTKPIDWALLVDTCAALIEARGKRAA